MKVHDENLLRGLQKLSDVLKYFVERDHFDEVVDDPELFCGVLVVADPDVQIADAVEQLVPDALALVDGVAVHQVVGVVVLNKKKYYIKY